MDYLPGRYKLPYPGKNLIAVNPKITSHYMLDFTSVVVNIDGINWYYPKDELIKLSDGKEPIRVIKRII